MVEIVFFFFISDSYDNAMADLIFVCLFARVLPLRSCSFRTFYWTITHQYMYYQRQYRVVSSFAWVLVKCTSARSSVYFQLVHCDCHLRIHFIWQASRSLPVRLFCPPHIEYITLCACAFVLGCDIVPIRRSNAKTKPTHFTVIFTLFGWQLLLIQTMMTIFPSYSSVVILCLCLCTLIHPAVYMPIEIWLH